jgi:lipooligosaccharide transport system permease protein
MILGRVDLRMALAVWLRNLTVYRHTWVMNILPNFFDPLLYLVGMGIGLGAYLGQTVNGRDYIAFIAPGLMASAAMNGASFETTYNVFVKMNFHNLYEAYLGTPAEPEDVVIGELLWAVTRALIYGLAFMTVLAGLTLAGRPILVLGPGLLLLPPAIAMTGLLFGLIGLAFTVVIKTIDLYSYYFTLFITPMFLFSGIFYPVSRFPSGEAIAWWTPLYHAVRLCRGLSYGELDGRLAVSAAWIAIAIVVLLVTVPGRYRRRMLK